MTAKKWYETIIFRISENIAFEVFKRPELHASLHKILLEDLSRHFQEINICSTIDSEAIGDTSFRSFIERKSVMEIALTLVNGAGFREDHATIYGSEQTTISLMAMRRPLKILGATPPRFRLDEEF